MCPKVQTGIVPWDTGIRTLGHYLYGSYLEQNDNFLTN